MATETTGAKEILSDEELNLGNSEVIRRNPQAIEDNSLIVKAEPVRLLQLRGDSQLGRTVTITMGQELTASEALQSGLFSGPIIGIIEFGNGGVTATVEFDIQMGSVVPALGTYPEAFRSKFRGGVAVNVPASAIRVAARNDNNVPAIIGAGSTDDGPPYSGVIIGRGGEIQDPTIFAHANYGTAASGNGLRRTIVIANGAGSLLDDDATVAGIGIPPFAKRVRFFRTAESTVLAVSFGGFISSSTSGPYTIAAGSLAPLEIPPGASNLTIQNITGGGTAVSRLQAVFDIEI